MDNSIRRQLPIGTSDFKEMIEKYYTVDKILLIKDILDNGSKVLLFTRIMRSCLRKEVLKPFISSEWLFIRRICMCIMNKREAYYAVTNRKINKRNYLFN